MKDYIVHTDNLNGFTESVRADVQKILDQTGGKIVSVSDGRWVKVVATEDAMEQIMALDKVTGMSEFTWSADGSRKYYSVGTSEKFDSNMRESIENVLKATGGKIIREGGYSVQVEASEAAAAEIEKLKGVDFVEASARQTLKNWHLSPPKKADENLSPKKHYIVQVEPGLSAKKGTLKTSFNAVVASVKEVLHRTGGELDTVFKWTDFLSVVATPEAAQEIKRIKGVLAITEKRHSKMH